MVFVVGCVLYDVVTKRTKWVVTSVETWNLLGLTNDRFVRTVMHIANTWDQGAACIVLCERTSVTDYDKNTVGSFVSPKSAKFISPAFWTKRVFLCAVIGRQLLRQHRKTNSLSLRMLLQMVDIVDHRRLCYYAVIFLFRVVTNIYVSRWVWATVCVSDKTFMLTDH